MNAVIVLDRIEAAYFVHGIFAKKDIIWVLILRRKRPAKVFSY